MAKEIKIRIYTKMVETSDGKKFATYQTRMNLPYIDKDGNNKGVQNRSVELKFNSDYAPKNNAKMFGILTIKSDEIDFPSKWQVKQGVDKKTGKAKDFYPTAWINGEWSYTEVKREATQAMFDSPETPVSDTPIELDV